MVMMISKQSYCFSAIVATLYFFFLVSFFLQTLAFPTLHYCRHDQKDALLEFKHEFLVNESDPNANDMSTWNKTSDCCSWVGVSCDAKSGKVISLDLGFNSLNNSLKPNSGLFKLQYLQDLVLSSCNLYGEIPSSLGNLSHLIYLDFSYNELAGQVPASIGNLTQLSTLRLSRNNLNGTIPVSFANLTKLVTLHLNNNYLESELPPAMSRLQNLKYLFLSGNSFSGAFPTFLFTIPSLQFVYMRRNQLKFDGSLEFGNISSSSKLHGMSLASNKLDGPFPETISKFINLKIIDLSFNNFIGPIPISISKLVNLHYLDLSNNRLEGKVPSVLLRLEVLKLSRNSFSRFGKSSEVVNIAQMSVLSLTANSFQGPFPHWICKFRSLELLDLSDNNFSGSIPPCLRNITNLLQALNLRNNNFSGTLPDMFANATSLRALDVSRNQLEGKLSKSLINCRAMKLLNVGSNKFKDKFPSWLGSLPSLNVLILGSNQFYGPLYLDPHVSIGFQSLKVIDLSQNDLSGSLPAFYFSNWRGMSTTSIAGYDEEYMYMEDFMVYTASYRDSMEMVHKGIDTEFNVIRKDFQAIDFSGNKFSGKISESIGLLKGLRLLNLSSNAFTGDIPQSLANLTNLEALDLSQNQLFGRIPQYFGMLSFLSTMNFSHNNLEGPIPQGAQFQTQNCSSFMYNPRLYGLQEICGYSHVTNPTLQEPDELLEDDEYVFNWIAAAIAYGPGVFCGLVIGHIFFFRQA